MPGEPSLQGGEGAPSFIMQPASTLPCRLGTGSQEWLFVPPTLWRIPPLAALRHPSLGRAPTHRSRLWWQRPWRSFPWCGAFPRLLQQQRCPEVPFFNQQLRCRHLFTCPFERGLANSPCKLTRTFQSLHRTFTISFQQPGSGLLAVRGILACKVPDTLKGSPCLPRTLFFAHRGKKKKYQSHRCAPGIIILLHERNKSKENTS